MDKNINSNFLNIDETLTIDEYKNKLISILKNILKLRFPNDLIKQEIHPHTDRITFSCPYCGDSMQSSYKRRGNIILSGKFAGFYKCFNCGIFKRVDAFFKDYKINLDLNTINYISSNFKNFSSVSGENYDISLILNLDLIEKYAIERQELKNRLDFHEVKEYSVYSWLKNRLQFEEKRFLYNFKEDYLVLLNLTSSGKILGFQKRPMKPKKWENKYLTFNAHKIYEELERKEEVPEEVNVLSQLFKILEIDFTAPVTLFEGAFDANLFKNSIANTGANKNFPLDIPIRYWYDSDTTGIKKAVEKINEGKEVFLWTKFSKDLGLPYKSKWDLNAVKIWALKNHISLPLFDNYFSSDPIDSIDI